MMGRRRTIGQARSAGSGRPCPHPRRSLEYSLGGAITRARCRRCGQELLPLEQAVPQRRRDKPWRPDEKG